MEDNTFDMENFLMLEEDQLDVILNNSRIEDQIMTVETEDLSELDIHIGEEGMKYNVETFNKEIEEFIKVNPEATKDMIEIKRMIESKMMQRSLGFDSDEEDVMDFDFKEYELDDLNVDELEYDKYKNVEIKEEDKSDGEDDLDLLGEDGDNDETTPENDGELSEEEINPFRLIFVNEEYEELEDVLVNKSPVEGKLQGNKYEDAFNGEMISSKRGLEDLHFKKFDYSSGEEIKNMSFGFEEEDDEDEERGLDKEEEEDDDDEDALDENPFHPDNLFDMGQYEDLDTDRFKKMITDLRNPESGPMFIYMGSCWMAGALIGTFRGFKKSLFRTPKRGWDRIFECLDYSKPIIERSSNLALRVGAVIGVTQLGLSFFFETNEYTRITSFGLGMLTYYKSFHPDLLSKAKMLTFFGLFSACCISMHQLRRTFNGYNGAEPLITFLSLTTHNPFIRYFLDVKLGITDFFFPNFYGTIEDYSITSPLDLPVSTQQVHLLDGTPKLEEDL